MTNISNDGLCNETSGFLFSHRCDRLAVKNCFHCGKPVCQDHAHPITEGTACTTCLKNESSPDPAAEEVAGSTPPGTPVTTTGNTNRSRPYYDDPYFYGSNYYPGYGYGYGYGSGYGYYGRTRSRRKTEEDTTASDAHDPNDFTEGDAESLRNEGDEAFESEMGES